ncbi:hypothetical protein APHAL10511_007871 [Amanita phalloides]|nr:hypothetical protein APHAL10511_007871 [Amanita phalloides]
MPPRRKPTSTRQKKAEQKLRRAIKRGDASPHEPNPISRSGPSRLRGQAAKIRSAQIDSVKRLQSAFIKLSPEFLEETKLIASTIPLPRPISDTKALFNASHISRNLPRLTCPQRPKWRYDMSKKEVEHNEEESDKASQDMGPDANPKSPSYFERNLEVWRQLWRVIEISQIILVLVDSRCPLLHYPPSLHDYLEKRKLIFVLTKVDITGPVCVKAWTDFLRTQFPETEVVQVESYTENKGIADQGRSRLEPHIPPEFRDKLVKAIKSAHKELLEPPASVKSNLSKLESWKSPVKHDINWEQLTHTSNTQDKLSGAHVLAVTEEEKEGEDAGDDADDLKYLTIGLIGQPNVGKSSLLNALFDEHKVKASRTPGKTKHFQTLFWTTEIRLVDCPGLVMPNYIPMELQVLCGILPISRISAVPACIHFVAGLLPLERILALSHPNAPVASIKDKRTWRDGMTPSAGTSKAQAWTAMDILIAHANAKGWVTAKAARPDVHRAGNHILRLLAEGRLGWSFWPPGTGARTIAGENGNDNGIWIPRFDVLDEEIDEEEEEQKLLGEEDNYDMREDSAFLPLLTKRVKQAIDQVMVQIRLHAVPCMDEYKSFLVPDMLTDQLAMGIGEAITLQELDTCGTNNTYSAIRNECQKVRKQRAGIMGLQ